MVDATLKPRVVSCTDPGEQGELLASQSLDASASVIGQVERLGVQQAAAGPQEVSERVIDDGHPSDIRAAEKR